MTFTQLFPPTAAALAPMAGFTDHAFRMTCKNEGAGYLVSEMTSAQGLVYGSKKTTELLFRTEIERPFAVQLFGSDPDVMARAASLTLEYSPDVIDINMGCPAPKIAGNRAGSALMGDPILAGAIVRAVVSAVHIPVTVKIRAGLTADCKNAVELARIAEQGGAAAVTVHGRTREQMYAPPVDLDIIRDVKRAVDIPVIGNGDVTDEKSFIHMREYTGCDYVMIGRGALGNPFIFRRIKALLTGQTAPAVTLKERMDTMLSHITLLVADKGEYAGIRQARSHVCHYVAGLRGAAALRARAVSLMTLADVHSLAEDVLSSYRGE